MNIKPEQTQASILKTWAKQEKLQNWQLNNDFKNTEESQGGQTSRAVERRPGFYSQVDELSGSRRALSAAGEASHTPCHTHALLEKGQKGEGGGGGREREREQQIIKQKQKRIITHGPVLMVMLLLFGIGNYVNFTISGWIDECLQSHCFPKNKNRLQEIICCR